ncbi:MAG: PilZ domain-containing protein [Desulfamplus sp.]
MTESENIGRRHYVRVPFIAKVVLIYSNSEVDITGCLANLSMKGLFVKTQKKVSPGMECNVKIILSGGDEPVELLIQSRVIRVEDDGIALLFDAMELDTYTHLKNIVQYNSPD